MSFLELPVIGHTGHRAGALAGFPDLPYACGGLPVKQHRNKPLKGSPTMLSTTSTPRAASSPESEGEYFRKKNWKHRDVKQRHGLHGYDQCINQIVATRPIRSARPFFRRERT